MKAASHFRKRMIAGRWLKPETLMMGYGYDPRLSEGAVKPPIFQTSTFVFESAASGKSFFELAYGKRECGPEEDPGLIYSRINNPDLEVLEDRLALWDDAEAALTFGSGMAAISTCMWTFLRPGDLFIHSEPVYGGSAFLFQKILPAFGVRRLAFKAGDSLANVRAQAESISKTARVKAIFVETPANPTSALVDIAECRELADALSPEGGRTPVIIDNTLLGPVWQQPLNLGADIVVYSLTKYVGGHSDVIAGACIGSDEWIRPIQGMRTILGTMLNPFDGWLLMRSLETLKIRMERSTENAVKIASFLRSHPAVERVDYLDFLETRDPQRALFDRQCHSAGSTFSFAIKGGEQDAFRFLDAVEHIKLAVSLGGTETLICHPATMTHSDIEPDVLKTLGVPPNLIRISVGVEDADDVIADLEQALKSIETESTAASV